MTILLTSTIWSQAQQINAVPDYVFRNQMSVGRNAVTDTAAYFSIGPRYGATKGFMPPIVGDTATFSSGKRNGLLIFSVQKNKFLYWDSVGVKWAEMAGTGGSAITGSGVAGYMPEFTTATNLDTTRLYHSVGRFAIGGTTVTNGVLNVYGGNIYTDNDLRLGSTTDWGVEAELTNFQIVQRTANRRNMTIDSAGNIAFGRLTNTLGSGAGMYLNTSKELIIANDATDAGAYTLQVNGNLYTTTGGVLAATSGEVYVGTTSDAGAYNLQVAGNLYTTTGGVLAASSGEVIIGTTTDAGDYRLQVNGVLYTAGNAVSQWVINATNANGSANLFQQNGSTIGWIGNGSSAVIGGSTSDFVFNSQSAIVFAQSGTRVATFNTSSEFLVGTGVDNGDFRLQVNGNAEIRGNIRTSAPPGGTANDWRLGTVATVSPTSPNRTIEVSIGGTIYYIHAKTTND